MWLFYSTKVALVINLILGVFLIVFVKNGYEIFNKLHVTDQEAVSGKFKDFSAYEQMQDLD